jgi:predicted acylesterase/phospholipase RssA
MTIKHLVFSGGGPSMIQTLGALQHLENNNVIKRESIKSIYGTSAGAIVGVLYCFQFDWDTINDYILKRPWKEVFPIKVQNIFDAYTKKGVFDIKTIEKCFKPLLNAKDLEIGITLKDFYEYSKIELHFFSFEINCFQIMDISYKTHPDLTLLTAIQMTCALPVLVTPVCIGEECFIDGGVVCNYPLQYCLEAYPDEKEIIGFKNCYNTEERNMNSKITMNSTLLDFIMNFLFKLIFSMSTNNKQPTITSEIILDTKYMSIEYFKNTFSSEEARRELLQNGMNAAIHFLKSSI